MDKFDQHWRQDFRHVFLLDTRDRHLICDGGPKINFSIQVSQNIMFRTSFALGKSLKQYEKKSNKIETSDFCSRFHTSRRGPIYPPNVFNGPPHMNYHVTLNSPQPCIMPIYSTMYPKSTCFFHSVWIYLKVVVNTECQMHEFSKNAFWWQFQRNILP